MRQFLNEDYLMKTLPVFCSKSIQKVIDVVYQLCPLLGQETLLKIIHTSVTSYGLLQCALHRSAFEEHSEISTGSKCSCCMCSMICTRYISAALAANLFQVQFPVLELEIPGAETIHGMGSGYLKDHVSLITSTNSNQVGQEEPVAGPINQSVSCSRTQERSLFCHGICLMEYHPSRDQIGLDLAGFLQGPEDMALPMHIGTQWCARASAGDVLIVPMNGIMSCTFLYFMMNSEYFYIVFFCF